MSPAVKSKLSGGKGSVSTTDMNHVLKKAFLPALILILLSASAGFLLYGFNLIIGQTENNGLADIRQILHEINIILEDPESLEKGLQDILVQQSRLIEGRIILIDMDSNLLADSRLLNQPVTGKYINAELSEAKVSDYASGYIRDKSQGTIQVTIARKISAASGRMVISVTYILEEVHKFFLTYLLLWGIIILSGCGIGAHILSHILRQYRQPLRKLLQSTDLFAGRGISKVSVDSNDEDFIRLAEVYNTLIDRYNLVIESNNRKFSRINTLLSHLKSGFLMADRKNGIIMVNPAAEGMLNLDKRGLFRIREISDKHSPVLEKIAIAIKEVNRTLETAAFTQKNDDESVLEISVEAVFNKYAPHEHSGVLVILHDVTESYHLEQLKDDFIANVSHELRTPLTLINGFVETLKSWELLSDEDRNTSLNIIEVETERLGKLINELLLLSRIEGDISRTVEKSPLNIKEILTDVVEIFESMRREKGIHTELFIPDPLPEITGVSSWYRQIIFNIYHNALKYTPEKGRVQISIQTKRDEFILTITDNGTGISEEDRPRIFERFYRVEKYTNREISGSGLGLTITKHMVNELGGTIDVSQSEEGGAMFTVVLPIV